MNKRKQRVFFMFTLCIVGILSPADSMLIKEARAGHFIFPEKRKGVGELNTTSPLNSAIRILTS